MPAIPVHVGGPGNPGRPILNTPSQDGAAVLTTLAGIYKTPSTIPDGAQPTAPSRIIKIPQVPATVFNDSGAGTITLSGSGVESFSTPPREPQQAVGQPTPFPFGRESRAYPQATPAQTFNDSGSGTITLAGSGVEAFSTPPHEPLSSVVQAVIPAVSLGSRILPQTAPSQTFNDSGSGTIVLSGSGVEQFSVAPRLTVITQGQTNQNGVTVPVQQNPPYYNAKDPQPQSFLFYNAAPPIYNVIVQGQTNQGFKFYQTPRETTATVNAPQIIRITAPTSFNDSGSGTLTLSGSGLETFTTPPRQPVAAVSQPTLPSSERYTRLAPIARTFTFFDSGGGTIVLSGSGFDVYVPPGGAGAPQEDPNHFVLLHA